jgi:hypothetical protein
MEPDRKKVEAILDKHLPDSGDSTQLGSAYVGICVDLYDAFGITTQAAACTTRRDLINQIFYKLPALLAAE